MSGIPEEAVLTPITEITHLAEAATQLGQTDRQIWVDRTPPPSIKTPGRVPGQWLMSGERLPEPLSQPIRPARPEPWEGFER
ncbi:hypothetical protein AB0L82_43280 [Nocardia sp. NPDC052001]|uniref:hypothetical protein n=1 Tax=Nocardia sp. NPDC052001 TaxID=3154853 RepID=UPI003425FA18